MMSDEYSVLWDEIRGETMTDAEADKITDALWRNR